MFGFSADQKKLISLGRGLFREYASAILIDKPLTVIDLDLKFKLCWRLKEINQLFNSILIYVTHDQNDTMTFAHKIIVINHGEIVQTGLQVQLFTQPKTTRVAHFIGSPAMHYICCKDCFRYCCRGGRTKTRSHYKTIGN